MRTSAESLILPTTIESSDKRGQRTDPLPLGFDLLRNDRLANPPDPAGCPGRPPFWSPFSKISFNMSTTLLASARSSLMNSLTTSAGGTSTWSIIFDQLADDTRVFRDQEAGRFRQREKRSVGLRRRQDIARAPAAVPVGIGITQLEKETDHVIAIRNIRRIGNDRHAGGARIFLRSDDLRRCRLRPGLTRTRS